MVKLDKRAVGASRAHGIRTSDITDPAVVLDRRAVIKKAALAAGAIAAGQSACAHESATGTHASKAATGAPPSSLGLYADPGRSLTPRPLATTYNNFYEFSTDKAAVHQLASSFQSHPWTLEVVGACEKPGRFDVESMARGTLEERVYRFRCVEAWAMTVPWLGFELVTLLKRVAPLSSRRKTALRPAWSCLGSMATSRRSRWFASS